MDKEYTLYDALHLARLIKFGLTTTEKDPYPTIPEAIELIEHCWMRKDFNWITGTKALECLYRGMEDQKREEV